MASVQKNDTDFQTVVNDTRPPAYYEYDSPEAIRAFFREWNSKGKPSDMAGWKQGKVSRDTRVTNPNVANIGVLTSKNYFGGAKRRSKASTKASGKASTKASRPPSRYANTGRKRDGKTVYRNRQTGAEYCKCKSAKTGKMTYRKLA